MFEVVAIAALAIWIYLLLARGGFWLAGPRADSLAGPPPAVSATVVAVVPARDEAQVVAHSVGSLLGQNYPVHVVLVDDGSTDGTAARATEAAIRLGAADRLTIVEGARLPAGWTGKLWAVRQGIEAALRRPGGAPRYLLLTDADIVHSRRSVASLLARAEKDRLVLCSVMAKLACESFAERAIVPAFVYFFQMLYPFAWVASGRHSTAAAAGGCMLVDTEALSRIGGIEAIRAALIDDCALAARLKPVGPIWLGLSAEVASIRNYPSFSELGAMVTRSAYAELRYSPLRLLAATLGMALTFLAAPVVALLAPSAAAFHIAVLAWLLMALSFQPILRFYRLSPLRGLALPAVALVYMGWTLQSALQYARGRGGIWKGRVQAIGPRASGRSAR